MASRFRLRLGMWMRLCIVLTVFWLVGATLTWGVQDAAKASDMAQAAYEGCSYAQSSTDKESFGALFWEGQDCWKERERTFNAYSPWTTALITSTALAVLAWIAGGILYGSARWILAGRKKAPSDA
jgi:hypothetical protein